MSSREVTNWNLRHQQQRQVFNQSEERNKSCHSNLPNTTNHHHHFYDHDENFTQLPPMSSFEVAELTWENGQLALNELGGIFPPPTSATGKPTWGGAGRGCDTLESIVQQAAYCNPLGPNLIGPVHNGLENVGSVVASSGGKLVDNSGPVPTRGLPPPPGLVKKRTRSEPDHGRRNNLGANDHESACASANAAVSKDNNDTTMMTWTSLDSSPRSCTRTKTTQDEDSACLGGLENHDDERDTKGETGPSHIPRRGRAAAVHNQSERRRRDRINQKMKALQKLVPTASKTDKASMLDEVIEYLKQLQAQVQMMSNTRLMPQFMMPFGMQQQLQQMSLLARMGLGIGMLDPTSNCHTPTPSHPISQLIHPNQVSTANSGYVPSVFVAPQLFNTTQQPNLDIGAGTSGSLQDPYSALLAQSMNLDLFNRLTALQRQQQAQAQQISNQMQTNNQMQGD